MKIGYFLSSEEWGPRDLVAQAISANQAGFEGLWIYDLPSDPTPILISGFGPKAIALAGRIGDGFCAVSPDPDAVRSYRSQGGEGKLVQGGTKVCWGDDEQAALEHVVRLWPNEALPGELPQVLPTPEHFEQAAQLVTPEMLAEEVVCGPNVDRHVAALKR